MNRIIINFICYKIFRNNIKFVINKYSYIIITFFLIFLYFYYYIFGLLIQFCESFINKKNGKIKEIKDS